MAIIKILKNQKSPAADIELKQPGVTVPASGTYIVESLEYNLWTTSDVITEITPFINSGDIVVNDSVRDLTAAEGIRYLEKVETVDIQKDDVDVVKTPTRLNFEGNVTVVNSGSGKATVTVLGTSEDEDKKMISVECLPDDQTCIINACLLVDSKLCFLKEPQDC